VPRDVAPAGLPAPVTGRRKDLLDAAAAVVARSGLRGLTHRAVDAEAGVPEGSTSGYYRTRLALLSALTAHVSGQLAAAVDAARLRIAALDLADPGQDERIEDEIVALVVGQAARADLVRVQVELGVESSRSPQLGEFFDSWRTKLVGLVMGIACEVAPDHANERAEITVAAFQGVLMSSLLRPEGERAAYVEGATRQLIALLSA